MLHPIHIKNEEFLLHYTGAVYWKTQDILLVADLHFGKITHFRKFGSAVPPQAMHRNFERLHEVVHFFKPKTICFLGDLFHSHVNNEWKLFEKWVLSASAKILLVHGNHDIISPIRYEKIGVGILEKLVLGPFVCTHHPEEDVDFINICGHIHPAVRLKGKGRQNLKLPCFFHSKQQLILPAFGVFTGTHMMKPSPKDRVYALVEKKVIPVN
ncbi:MAG: ligase-associated DNA damage response endonuclease PdeM [Saonia sp.]